MNFKNMIGNEEFMKIKGFLFAEEDSQDVENFSEINEDFYKTNNKQRLTVQISEEIIDKAKNAVYWTRGLTIAKLTEEALKKEIKNLEKDSIIYDDDTGRRLKEKGDGFPHRKEDLKSGRPIEN